MKKDIRGTKKPLLILIGGTVGVGKSALSLRLASRLKIPEVVPTDAVREILIAGGGSKDYFLDTTTHCAWRKIGAKNKKNIIEGYKKHCRSTLPAIIALANNYLTRGKDCVIEGAHIPLIDLKKIHGDGCVILVLLELANEKIHRQRLDKKYIERHGRKKDNYDECADEFLMIQEFNRRHCRADLTVDAARQNAAIGQIIGFIKQKANG